MSFLTPLYLLGALAISLPVVLHFIRRTPRGKFLFSSLMFLSPSPPQVARRSRLENWPLLLLRCLALILLAIAFARPYVRDNTTEEPLGEPVRQWAILLDTSASMQRTGIWEEAVAQVEQILQQTGISDDVAFYTFSDRAQVVVDFEQWRSQTQSDRIAAIRAAVAQLRPGWGATNLGGALSLVADELSSITDRSAIIERNIFVVSDMQAGSHIEQLQDYSWPSDVVVTPRVVHCDSPNNAGLQWLDDPTTFSGTDPRIRIRNAFNATAEQFRLLWQRKGEEPIELTTVYVPAGESRVVRPKLPISPVAAHIVLQGDAHQFDNTLHWLPAATNTQTVVYQGEVDPDDPQSLGFYLREAFSAWPSGAVEVLFQSTAIAQLDDTPRLIIIADQGDPERLDWVRKQVAAGSTAIIPLANKEMIATVNTLLGTQWSCEEGAVQDYVMLSQPDFSHPLFAPFQEPQFRDFTKTRFWHFRQIDIASEKDDESTHRVVAQFDNGEPAIIETSLGKGHVFVWATTWSPRDGQLALSSKFVPLLGGLLNYDGLSQNSVGTILPGQTVDLAPWIDESGQRPITVTLPDATTYSLKEGETSFARTQLPGVYEVSSPGDDVGHLFAVHVSPEESETAPLLPEDLGKLGPRLAKGATIDVTKWKDLKRQQLASEMESQHKLWRWLCIAAIGVLVTETWLAGHLVRREIRSEGAMT